MHKNATVKSVNEHCIQTYTRYYEVWKTVTPQDMSFTFKLLTNKINSVGKIHRSINAFCLIGLTMRSNNTNNNKKSVANFMIRDRHDLEICALKWNRRSETEHKKMPPNENDIIERRGTKYVQTVVAFVQFPAVPITENWPYQIAICDAKI